MVIAKIPVLVLHEGRKKEYMPLETTILYKYSKPTFKMDLYLANIYRKQLNFTNTVNQLLKWICI